MNQWVPSNLAKSDSSTPATWTLISEKGSGEPSTSPPDPPELELELEFELEELPLKPPLELDVFELEPELELELELEAVELQPPPELEALHPPDPADSR